MHRRLNKQLAESTTRSQGDDSGGEELNSRRGWRLLLRLRRRRVQRARVLRVELRLECIKPRLRLRLRRSGHGVLSFHSNGLLGICSATSVKQFAMTCLSDL